MIPASTALAQTAAARKLSVGFFYLPHGAIMDNTSKAGVEQKGFGDSTGTISL